MSKMTKTVHVPASSGDVPTKTTSKQNVSDLCSAMQVKAQRIRLRDDSLKCPLTENARGRSGKSELSKVRKFPCKQPSSSKKTGAPSQYAYRGYRPAYTWNRGGRLKELRIRTVARKFFDIWKKNVFGRVLPSVAQQHYDDKIIRDAYREWKDMWWTERKEWGLGIRADLHNRYRLWNLVWQPWRTYTAAQRVKTQKKKQASRHAELTLLSQVFSNWTIYIHEQKAKRDLYAVADELRNANLVRSAWSEWKCRLQAVRDSQAQHQMAVETYERSLLRQAWKLWHGHYQRKRLGAYRGHQADLYYQSRLKSHCVNAWMQYTVHRRHQNKLNAGAGDVLRYFTLRRCFNHWQQRFTVIIATRQHHQQIEVLATRAKCRRVLIHWMAYVEYRRERNEQKAVADEYYTTTLKRLGLHSFRLYVVQQRVSALRNQQAAQFRNQQLVKTAWLTWTSALEAREEEEIAEQTSMARHHHRSAVMLKCLDRLKEYAEYRQYRKSQYDAADEYYRMRKLGQCFGQMMDFVEIQQRKKELQHMQQDFLRDHLVARCFQAWHVAYQNSQDQRMMMRMAILHDEETTVRRFFVQWRNHYYEVQRDAFNMEVATEHYERSLCQRAFAQWRDYIDLVNAMYEDEQTAEMHHKQVVLTQVLQGWTQYTLKRRTKKAHTALALRHYHHKQKSRCLSAWKMYRDRMRRVQLLAEQRWKTRALCTLRWALQQWQVGVQLQKLETEKERLADRNYQQTISSKVLYAWHAYMVYRVDKTHRQTMQIQAVQKRLNFVRLQHTWIHWRSQVSESILERGKMEVAAEHDYFVRLRKAWLLWKEYTKTQQRKALLQRQGQWFHNMRLQAKFFVVWQCRLQEAQHENEQTMLALWHWSCRLQRKVVIAWWIYAQERKRKKERLQDALEIRRLRLLKDGATKWLAVATDLSATRQNWAMQRGVQAAYKSQQIARKAGSHWRRWAASRRGIREAQGRHHQGSVQSCATPSNPEAQPFGAVLPRTPLSLAQSGSNVSMGKHVSSASHPAVLVRPVPASASPKRVIRPERPVPRLPSFMVDSLKRDGLYHSTQDQLLTDVFPEQHPHPHPEGQQSWTIPSGAGDGGAEIDFNAKHLHVSNAEQHPTMSDAVSMAINGRVPAASHDLTTMSRVSSASKLSRGQVVQQSTPREDMQTVSQPTHQQGHVVTLPEPPYHMNIHYEEDLRPSSQVPPLALSSDTLSFIESPSTILPKSTSLPNVPASHKGLSITIPNKPLPSQFPVFSPEDQPRPPLGPLTAEVLSQTYDLHRVTSDAMTFLPTSDSEESVSIRGRHTAPSHLVLLPPAAFFAKSDSSAVNTAMKDPRKNTVKSSAFSSSLSSGSSVVQSPRDMGGVVSAGNITLLSPADEMVYIRNQLQCYQQDKQKYSSCLQNQTQLETLVNTLRVDQSQDGRTLAQLMDELDLLEEELSTLKTRLDTQKPEIKKLAQRAKELVPTLK